MEDILDLYACPEDPEHPVVCVDETSKQHLQQTRPPLRLTVGKPYRYDSEYKRNGVRNSLASLLPFFNDSTTKKILFWIYSVLQREINNLPLSAAEVPQPLVR